MERPMPHIGDTVRLLPSVRMRRGAGPSKKAKVIGYLVDGGVRLDDRLDGFQYWNKNDLEILPRK